MQITNCFEVPFLFFIASIQVSLPPDLSSAYTMGFVPVQFSRSDLAVRKLNACSALEFAPATFAVRFLKPSQVANGCFDGDSLNIRNFADNFKFYSPRIPQDRDRSGPGVWLTASAAASARVTKQFANILAREAVGCKPRLGRYLFEGEIGNVHALTRVLDGNTTDSAFSIKVQKCVFIEVTSFGNLDRTQFNVESVCILIVFNLHGVNDRSKKAL